MEYEIRINYSGYADLVISADTKEEAEEKAYNTTILNESCLNDSGSIDVDIVSIEEYINN